MTLDAADDVRTSRGPGSRSERAIRLHAAFAPPEAEFDPLAADGAGWGSIAFWWPTRLGVQLVLMPCRTPVQ